jgi:hypothetical protein
MDNVWEKEKSNLLTELGRKIKREKWFVLSEKTEYSISIKYPLTLIPNLMLNSYNHTIKVYHNGKEIERYDNLPEHSLDYMLGLIGNRLVSENA